jgi:hypothetical protein
MKNMVVDLACLCTSCQVQNCRDLGATVHLQGAHIGEARDIANGIAAEHGLTYINGFDHPHIIAGAGTMVGGTCLPPTLAPRGPRCW